MAHFPKEDALPFVWTWDRYDVCKSFLLQERRIPAHDNPCSTFRRKGRNTALYPGGPLRPRRSISLTPNPIKEGTLCRHIVGLGLLARLRRLQS
jgi:hypothetical protein